MNRNELFFDPVEESSQLAVIELTEEDGSTGEYAVLAIFSSPPYAYEYMAAISLEDLEKDEDEQEILFMRYTEEEDGFILDGIDNEVEMESVTAHYFSMS